MKLENRERVDGTNITIGQRVYYQKGKSKISRRYAAEFTSPDGKQVCKNLKITSRAQARRKAIEIQQQLDRGIQPAKPTNITIEQITDRYMNSTKAKGVAPKTVLKYETDLEKLKNFCQENNIHLARQFGEEDLYLYRQYLVEKKYAGKTVYGAIVLAKQVFKWAWRQKILQDYQLGAATFPKAKAAPQPCFTTEQVDNLIEVAVGEEKTAFALMGYSGLRIGEVEQLCWIDIKGSMIHVRRGGSNGTTKDKDDRFVPIHPRVDEHLGIIRNHKGRVFQTINARKLLKRLKNLCKECGFENPMQYKLHSFRHHFASMCANHGVAHRKVLAWLGHSSSEMLDLYYHLHDDDSQQTMMELAKSSNNQTHKDSSNKGNLRAMGQSKIVGNPQSPEFKELAECLSNVTERAGFEPAVQLPIHTLSKGAP
jgi:site-specific recombinase XerD